MADKLNPDGILTTDEVWWKNAHTNPPPLGATVMVLNRDGVQAARTQWGRDSVQYFDGWLPAPRVPADIKAIQLARYPLKEEDGA